MKRIFRTVAFALALGAMSASFVACEDDENGVEAPAANEVIETANFKIKANADGTIQFLGDVESNAKIKTFQLIASDGKTVVYDFVETNEQVKEKLKNIADDGKVTKEKIFSVKGIASSNIPVDLYTLVIKTKDAKTEVALGETLEYKIGAKESKTGSYLSIVNNDAFEMEVAETKACEIVAVSSADGKSVIGLKKGSAANNSKVKAIAGKVALFEDGKAVDQINNPSGAVVITESGCICKISSLEQDATGDATIKAVTIKKTDKTNITVDVNGYTFSK